MTSHEIFVSSPELYGDRQTTKYRDVDERFVPGRKELRAALLDIMQPYIDEVLTPALRALYPETCDRPKLGADRACTPCYSLVRRYERGKRQSHAAHYDGHAIATAVVSLSDYGVDYKGGLYVSTSHGQREYAALGRGDAVLHRSSLLHGVQVHDVEGREEETERWSWIVWFRDSATCQDFGHEVGFSRGTISVGLVTRTCFVKNCRCPLLAALYILCNANSVHSLHPASSLPLSSRRTFCLGRPIATGTPRLPVVCRMLGEGERPLPSAARDQGRQYARHIRRGGFEGDHSA